VSIPLSLIAQLSWSVYGIVKIYALNEVILAGFALELSFIFGFSEIIGYQ